MYSGSRRSNGSSGSAPVSAARRSAPTVWVVAASESAWRSRPLAASPGLRSSPNVLVSAALGVCRPGPIAISVPGTRRCNLFVALLRVLGLLRDHRTLTRGIDDALLDPLVAAVEHAERALGVQVVVVVPQLLEEHVGTTAGLAAEQIRQLTRLLGTLGMLL